MFKLKSELMVGGADILVAGIAYVVPDWKIFIVTVGSIGRGGTIWKLKSLSMCPYYYIPSKGLISVITGLITVQKAKINTVKEAKESTFDQISSVAFRFFTSLELIKTTFCVVSTVSSQLQLSFFFQGTVLTTSMMCSYGLSLSVGNLAGSTFLNFACLGAADIVGKILVVVFMRVYPRFKVVLGT